MKKTQTISEYVGMGHPDRVADEIAEIVRNAAKTSAAEVIINAAGCYISGEVEIKKSEKASLEKQLKRYLKELEISYKGVKSVPIVFNFVEQVKELAVRRLKSKAGDQEIVYYTELKPEDAHYKLRQIDKKVSAKTHTLDYKTLLNLETKEANLSISADHFRSEEMQELITAELKKAGAEKINTCIFKGGSIWNDTGVTGRKIIVQQSGCGFPHGGGATHGKDLTKTATRGQMIARVIAQKGNYDEVVVVYFPGDELRHPRFTKGEKGGSEAEN